MGRTDYLPVSDLSHGIKEVGQDIGRPAVKVTMDESDVDGDVQVSSVASQFDRYGWDSALSSGRSYLVFRGPDVLRDEFQNALDTLLDIANPRYVELQVDGEDEPMRLIKNQVDSYVVDIGVPDDDVPEFIEFYAEESQRTGASSFVFDYEYQSKTREAVKDFTHQNRIYDYDTYLRVPEDKEDFASAYEQAEKVCVQNGWYLCPPGKPEAEEDDDS